MTDTVEFRRMTPDDEPFLAALYATTREEEMALVDWDDDQKRAFLSMQFRAQHTYYLQQFPDANYDVLVRDGRPVGRLYVDRRPDEVYVLDIALLPEYRNAGLGGALMRGVMGEAAAAGKPVRIHVESFNRALRFYQRLGFTHVTEEGIHLLMEWSPAAGGGRDD